MVDYKIFRVEEVFLRNSERKQRVRARREGERILSYLHGREDARARDSCVRARVTVFGLDMAFKATLLA